MIAISGVLNRHLLQLSITLSSRLRPSSAPRFRGGGYTLHVALRGVRGAGTSITAEPRRLRASDYVVIDPDKGGVVRTISAFTRRGNATAGGSASLRSCAESRPPSRLPFGLDVPSLEEQNVDVCPVPWESDEAAWDRLALPRRDTAAC